MLFAIFLLLFSFLGKESFLLKLEKEPLAMGLLPFIEIERKDKVMPLKYTSDVFEAGMNILIYGRPDMIEAKQTFEHLRSLGINSVALNFPFYQTNWQSDEVTTSSEHTPSLSELDEIIGMAHDIGLSVMIRPIMDEEVFFAKNLWRGQIKPKDPAKWFDSYEQMILTYAKLAESSEVESLNIGTELNSMQNKYQDRWIELIESVRRVYNGKLLYSFNYDTVSEIPSLKFVTLLDQIGIDAYFPLDLPDHAQIDMLEEEWERQIDQLKETLSDYTIVITEVGIFPIVGAYRTPYLWSFPDGTYDPQTQANYYEATYNVWQSRIEGIYWWVVTLGQNPNDISFSPLKLPTEEVLKKHFLKYF